MSNENIQELVAKLRQEMQVTVVDEDTRSSMLQLESELEVLLDPADPSTDSTSVMERAKQLEARFATDYPTAERYVREIVDMLIKMGV